MGLYRQSCIDGEDFEEEGQLTLEGVFNLGAQAGREVGDPLAQRGLCNSVVFNLGITLWVGTHPQLKHTTLLSGEHMGFIHQFHKMWVKPRLSKTNAWCHTFTQFI